MKCNLIDLLVVHINVLGAALKKQRTAEIVLRLLSVVVVVFLLLQFFNGLPVCFCSLILLPVAREQPKYHLLLPGIYHCQMFENAWKMAINGFHSSIFLAD